MAASYTEYRYDRKLSASEALVCLIDVRRDYPDLAPQIERASEEYGFTFCYGQHSFEASFAQPYLVRHLIICAGYDTPDTIASEYGALLSRATSATVAMAYSSEQSFVRARPIVDELKRQQRGKVNYLRPTRVGERFLPSLQKLVDNSICDSVRVKYSPNPRGHGSLPVLPADIRDFFSEASALIEKHELFHRAATDGFISVRDHAGEGFYISCTKTSKVGLDLTRIARVESYDRARNSMTYTGRYLPSSDSVEAAVLYQRLPHLQAIIHTHASAQFTRNPLYRHKIAVPPSRYGDAALGDALADYLSKEHIWDFLIMDDHGELFVSRETSPLACVREISSLIDSLLSTGATEK